MRAVAHLSIAMEDPFLLKKETHKRSVPQKALNRAQPPSSEIENAEVYPSFLHRIPFTNKRDDLNRVENSLLTATNDDATFPWTRSLPGVPYQLTIHPPKESFPQQQTLEIADVADPLTRWEFRCTLFNICSLGQQAGWGKNTERERLNQHDFLGFGDLIKKRVESCRGDPQRYHLEFCISTTGTASLFFKELVRSYRHVELLRIDFDRMPWIDMQNAVCRELEALKAEGDLLAFRWLKTVETISSRRPSLLAKSMAASSLQPRADRAASDAWDKSYSQNSIIGDTSSTEVIDSKIVPLYLQYYWSMPTKMDDRDTDNEMSLNPEPYSVTLYKTEFAYKLSIKHPTSPFLHYTSEDIVDKHIAHLLRSAKTEGADRAPSLRCDKNGRSAERRKAASSALDRRGKQTTATVTPTVPGILSDDFLDGCILSPESYRAIFVIHTHSACHPDHRAGLVMEYRNLPDTRWHTLMGIRFRRTAGDLIAKHVREVVSIAKDDLALKRERLSNVINIVKAKDPELLRLADEQFRGETSGRGDQNCQNRLIPDNRQSSISPPPNRPVQVHYRTENVEPKCTRIARHEARDRQAAERAKKARRPTTTTSASTANRDFRHLLQTRAANAMMSEPAGVSTWSRSRDPKIPIAHHAWTYSTQRDEQPRVNVIHEPVQRASWAGPRYSEVPIVRPTWTNSPPRYERNGFIAAGGPVGVSHWPGYHNDNVPRQRSWVYHTQGPELRS
ncbi:hypothetical protein DFJ77DRAFT_522685 [Powellomyces hirtus]|nr:hypothetical protein DFJ77DRAFT_522685 [Powellomyces hirtus]